MRHFSLSEAHYEELSEEMCGLCTSCGAEQSGCEPDARRYKCEECGEHAVYGVEELLMMGQIDLDGEDDDLD